MASRKKKQGKLRRAAKAAEAKAEAEARQVAEDEVQPQPQPLEEEEEDRLGGRLIRQDPVPSMNLPHSPPIRDKFWTQPREEGDYPWLRLSNKCSCLHSILDLEEFVRTKTPDFVSTFWAVYVDRPFTHRDVGGGRELTMANLFMEAPADMWRHFVTVWKYPQKIFQIVSYCLTAGTDSIIDRRYEDARFYASFASYFVQFCPQRTPSGSTLRRERAENFFSAHEDTVTRFFKKHIFCSCLNPSNVEIDVEMDVETKVEALPAKGNEFAWLDSALQHYESLHDAIEEEKYDLCDIEYALSKSEIDSLAMQPRSEETLLKLELSRHYTQLEEVKMCMRTTRVEEYACLNFALDQFSQHLLLMNLDQCWEEIDSHWSFTGSRNECTHGCDCETFNPNRPLLFSFSQKFVHKCSAIGGTIGRKFQVVYRATMQEYSHVWNDPIIMKYTTSFFLAVGAQQSIIGNYNAARLYAAIAYCFEQHISTTLCGKDNRKAINWPKVNELYFDPDEHTLISFFRKRIRCSCLDKKYKEVKSIAKLGVCCNLMCRHPEGKVERSTMKCCSRCHLANYCSRKCQVENWPVHKKFCQQSYQLNILDLYRRNHQRRN
eukprot:scaffold22845_cov85-Skeletonema_dohrnii-CCMP3373.AAC.2